MIQWWTIRSSGQPALGTSYELDFGPEYLWRAVVTRSAPGEAFELRLAHADTDWTGTLAGFDLAPSASGTQVRFSHRAGPRRTGTIGRRATAGRCIFERSAAIWSSARPCPTTSGSMFDI